MTAFAFIGSSAVAALVFTAVLLCGDASAWGTTTLGLDGLERSFLVKISSGCTGSLLTNDWVLTAAHCIKSEGMGSMEEDKDKILEGDEITIQVSKIENAPLAGDKAWTNPLKSCDTKGIPSCGHFRRVIKIIVHKNYINEALSWKGFDVALIQLEPGAFHSDIGSVLPVCLPNPSCPDRGPNTFVAGYGRRRLAHCVTDDQGPASFLPCDRHPACDRYRLPRGATCDISFEYGGEQKNRCLLTPNPSANQTECRALHQQKAELKSKTVHVFKNDEEFVTTCYPLDNPGGWCGVRQHGKESKEAEPNSGWGFCSRAPNLPVCTHYEPAGIGFQFNSTPFDVDELEESFCKKKLGANLAVEQPDVGEEEFSRLREELGVACIGRNYTLFPLKHTFVSMSDGENITELTPTRALVRKAKVPDSSVNGGPSCYGDSGGPLYRLVEPFGRVTPVQVGVFSFMLWGMCTSQDDPGYYVRTKPLVEWIQGYVPKDEMCYV